MRSSRRVFVMVAFAAILGACATAFPMELVDARSAYSRASHGPAATLAPADLRNAKIALDQAERAFNTRPFDQATRDLALLALRKAQLAELLASPAVQAAMTRQAEQDLQRALAEQHVSRAVEQARADLARLQQDTSDAEQRTKRMQERLSDLSSVKVDERGTIVMLAGSVLFVSNRSTLLPSAKTRLGEVSAALMEAKERNIRIESHTDSQGSDRASMTLSRRRAEAVRTYLVSRGYEPERVRAQGMGKAQPIASNDDAEGRANNRRVEIVVEPLRVAP